MKNINVFKTWCEEAPAFLINMEQRQYDFDSSALSSKADGNNCSFIAAGWKLNSFKKPGMSACLLIMMIQMFWNNR